MPNASKKTANKKRGVTPSTTDTARGAPPAPRNTSPDERIDTDRGNSSGVDHSTWLNWDVIGISTTAVTLAGAAIFFVSGWFYEARWYGFYGLNISQLHLSPIDFMVQGIPGILVFLITFCFSWLLIQASKGLLQTFWRYQIRGDSTGVQLINLVLRSELVWVGLLSYLLLALLDVSAEITLTVLFRKVYQTSYLTLAGILASLLIVLSMTLGLSSFGSSTPLVVATLSRVEWYLHEFMPSLQAALKGMMSILTVFVIALTFILSISLSGILGQFDAISHRKSLPGWFVPQTVLTSEERIPILDHYRLVDTQTSEENIFTYGTFGLVASDEEKYYLVEYQAGRYQRHPVVYGINKQAVNISFVIRDVAYLDFSNPESQGDTATPMPTTFPTSTPTIATTVTPTP